MDEKELYSRAIALWGKDAQMDIMIQECAELIHAITNYRRCRVSAEHILSELVDCQIMIDQMRLVLYDEAHGWDKWKSFKLERLELMISQSMESKSE